MSKLSTRASKSCTNSYLITHLLHNYSPASSYTVLTSFILFIWLLFPYFNTVYTIFSSVPHPQPPISHFPTPTATPQFQSSLPSFPSSPHFPLPNLSFPYSSLISYAPILLVLLFALHSCPISLLLVFIL